MWAWECDSSLPSLFQGPKEKQVDRTHHVDCVQYLLRDQRDPPEFIQVSVLVISSLKVVNGMFNWNVCLGFFSIFGCRGRIQCWEQRGTHSGVCEKWGMSKGKISLTQIPRKRVGFCNTPFFSTPRTLKSAYNHHFLSPSPQQALWEVGGTERVLRGLCPSPRSSGRLCVEEVWENQT